MATTKADAALQLLGLARDIDRALAGDEDADGWVSRILWLVRDLHPAIGAASSSSSAYTRGVGELYDRLLLSNGERESKETKIRKLALHPDTPIHERENAVRALAGLVERRRAADRI
jgi:hypothetical protein